MGDDHRIIYKLAQKTPPLGRLPPKKNVPLVDGRHCGYKQMTVLQDVMMLSDVKYHINTSPDLNIG